MGVSLVSKYLDVNCTVWHLKKAEESHFEWFRYPRLSVNGTPETPKTVSLCISQI